MEKKSANIKVYATVLGIVSIIAIALLVFVYLSSASNSGTATGTSSSSSASSDMQGVVTGYVTVGPSRPVCSANQACNVNMSGYSLVFTPQCSGSAPSCQARTAELTPSGHYSILLPPGNYSVTGLIPSCNWVGCSSAFPKAVVVEGGMQLVFNISVDTGIR